MKQLIHIIAFLMLSHLLGAQQSISHASGHGYAPSFSLMGLNGQNISMDDYKGKYVVIHIATTWCPYCNAEAPHLQKIYEEYRDKNVEVLIIDVKEPANLVDKMLREKHGLTFPILIDSDGAVAGKFAPENVLPELARDEIMLASNLLIDPHGKIQFMSLLDTRNFDSKLVHIRAKLDQLLLQDRSYGIKFN